ncbi:hypothetical protein KK103_15665 [Curtobacterium flaccumfaciens pv. flaccumfaciens]|uniref:Uncharacterized protein n=1 Tax=Curtobacterium flaccumfaciens pv. flaccumfaciens TaxID=138532 RepID=A0A9Q2W6M6_9MICO|nr:hypothetical protein [Curtobacterium flaccumfaciens]MBT1543200.1 hypothetical protein [Curtobacterium flaccumfaciens pv. flaccumfaciens]
MSTADQEHRTVVRFFTRVRRVPILLGKLNGWKIPGGPYTLTQMGIGSVVLVVGWNSKPLWGPLTGLTPLLQLGFLLAFSAGATWAAGKIPQSNRKLPDLVQDAYGAFTVPASGRYKGALIRLPRPQQVEGVVLMQWDDEPVTAAALTAPAEAPARTVRQRTIAPAPAPAEVPAPEPEQQFPDNVIPIRRRRYATGVERLLEQARKETHS